MLAADRARADRTKILAKKKATAAAARARANRTKILAKKKQDKRRLEMGKLASVKAFLHAQNIQGGQKLPQGTLKEIVKKFSKAYGVEIKAETVRSRVKRARIIAGRCNTPVHSLRQQAPA